MDVDLALLADAATIDASGKLNILGIFDTISVPQLPAQHPHVSLVLRFSASVSEAGAHQVDIRLIDPERKEVVHMGGEVQVAPGPARTGGRIRVPQVVNIDRLLFEAAGRYTFEISVDGEHQAGVPLTVHYAPSSVGGGMPPVQA